VGSRGEGEPGDWGSFLASAIPMMGLKGVGSEPSLALGTYPPP
jgi:hypothetical protein